jgi:hypothetical protein
LIQLNIFRMLLTGKLGMPNNVTINRDAFSSGQISSKLWLCEELEKLGISTPQICWVYGGWYGLVSFLLLSRNKFPIKHIRSFDIDPACESVADAIMENWVWKSWKFKAVTADCNKLEFTYEKPDIVINCSTEHFESIDWFKSVPVGTLMVLQSNNMVHEDHWSCFATCDEFTQFFNLNTLYQGTLDFVYPTWKFSRFMIIGTKK